LRVRHRVGADIGGATIAKTLFDVIVQAIGFGLLVCRFDCLVAKTIRQNPIVVGMCQLVQREVRHSRRFLFEDPHVGELDRFFHGRIAVVFAQPTSAGMILGPRLHVGIFGRNPQRHLVQFSNGRRGNDLVDFLKLFCKQFQSAVGRLFFLLQQLFADLNGPAFDFDRFVV
jgi:hypothetical protein